MTNYSFQSVGPIFIITGSTTYNIFNVGYTVIDMDALDNEQLLLVKKGLEYNYLTSPDEVDVLAYISTNATEPGSISPEQVQNIIGSMITSQNGAIQITNSAGQILFDAPYAKGPLNQKSGFFEDFITYSGTVVSPYLLRAVSGIGAATTIGTANNGGDTRNGYIVFTTGVTNDGLAAVASGGLSSINFVNIPVGGYEEFGARFKIPSISDETQSFQVILGFGDSAFALAPTDGVYMSIGPGTVGIQNNTSSNSIRTNSGALLTPVANTDYIARIRVSNVDGTLTSSFFINGSQLGTALTTNIPSGAGRELGIQFGIAKLIGTTSRVIGCDWIYHESFKPRTINY